MAGSTSDLRNGAILRYNNVLCTVLDYEHRTPGKGPASYQAKLRNLQTGKLIEARFRSGESIDFVRVERHPYEYLYKDGEDYIGIVPDHVFPRYCHRFFPAEDRIIDFLNLGYEDPEKIIKNAFWYPLKPVLLSS